ncbi:MULTISPECIES: helix-turn-helix domain-containing protein [Bifidobacterium]
MSDRGVFLFILTRFLVSDMKSPGARRCDRGGRRRHGYGQGGGVRRWRHQDFGCWRVGLVASMPRVDCPECGVVVARVPWAEPGSRFTRDFEAECAWLMGVANRKTVSGSCTWRGAPRATSPAGSRIGSGRRCRRRSTG